MFVFISVDDYFRYGEVGQSPPPPPMYLIDSIIRQYKNLKVDTKQEGSGIITTQRFGWCFKNVNYKYIVEV